jgi:FkbM family methyltransferase
MRPRDRTSRLDVRLWRTALESRPEVRRLARLLPFGTSKRDAYYQVSPSCQIPNLSFLYELMLGRRTEGKFVEIGAFDGITYSNTSCLALAGWSGWYVEPVPTSATACRRRYASMPAIDVDELAIGAEEGEAEIFLGGELSTPDDKTMNEYREVRWAKGKFRTRDRVRVRQVTLDQYLTMRSVPVDFDLLVVDVEGYEPSVFQGFTLGRWLPKMMIVELADAHPDLEASRNTHAQVLLDVLQHGYITVYKDAINTVLVTADVYHRAHGLKLG